MSRNVPLLDAKMVPVDAVEAKFGDSSIQLTKRREAHAIRTLLRMFSLRMEPG